MVILAVSGSQKGNALVLHMFATDESFVRLAFQLVFNLSVAIERTVGEYFIHKAHNPNFFRTYRHRLVVKAAAGNVEKLSLPGNG